MQSFTRTPFHDYMDELAVLTDGKWFFAKVAGTGFPNEDGSSRQAAIVELEPRQELLLQPDPDNPHDENAVRVLRPDGVQLGWLEARLAGETVRRTARGVITKAYVSNITGETSQSRGLVLGILIYARPGAE